MLSVKIFWCKTNRYFTERWATSPELEWAEGVFVASCVVTDKAKAKWIKFVRKEAESLPSDAKIYLSGCGSIRSGEVDSGFYDAYPELRDISDKIVLLGEDPGDAPSDKAKAWRAPEHSPQEGSASVSATQLLPSRIRAIKRQFTAGLKLSTRKYLVVQTGCDNYCTFCLTVQARGSHKSRPMDEILEEVESFVQSGGKEVVLTGTNLGAWGAPKSTDADASRFVELVRAILDYTSIERLRISSLGVEFLTDDMIALFAEPRINAYAHLSVQSASESVLKAMHRNYSRAFLLEKAARLQSLQRKDGVRINIWADMIVGFPGETEADFQDSLNFVREYVTQIHPFPFSSHQSQYSVPARLFPDQIDESIKADRYRRISEAGAEAKDRFLRASDGSQFRLLTERNADGTFRGWSENYIALSEANFTPQTPTERGKISEWTYRYVEWIGELDLENDADGV